MSLPQRTQCYFIPRRYKEHADPSDLSSLEILLVRRPFDAPVDSSGYRGVDYPGEWMFPGGPLEVEKVWRKKNTDDANFPPALGPAVHYLFRQLCIQNPNSVHWNTVYQFPESDEERYFEFRISHFFTGVLVDLPEQAPPVALPYRWFTPRAAFDLVTSASFIAEQNTQIKQHNLSDPSFGLRATKERVFSPATHKILEYLTRDGIERRRLAYSLEGGGPYFI